MIELLLLGAVSLAVGVLSGMVGMALGVVRLPIMLIVGIEPLIAAGTNLAVSTAGGAAGAWPHLRAGRVVKRVVITMGVPALVGSFVGGRFAHVVPSWILLALVVIFLLWSSIVMFTRVMSDSTNDLDDDDKDKMDTLGASYKQYKVWMENIWGGLIIGVVGGAVGLVMGVVRMPTLITVFNMAPTRAIGTNTVIGLLAGLFGFAGHLSNHHIDWLLVGVMGCTAMIGSFSGARMMGRLDPGRLLLLIALVVLLMAPLMAWRAYLYI